ncbi:MAG TPA: outer membrane protein assembly factor BamE [Caulobacteraceae bacterium]|jgi:outer membrane protein assembly factor BamE (lipoprotein component of BamABCDE complex)
MIRRVAAPLSALLVSAALISGCTPTSMFQGFQAIESKPQDVKIGEDTKSTVLTRLGSPSTVSTFDPNVWFYVSQVTQYESFYKPKIIRRDVVAVSFNKADEKVATVSTLSLKDGRVIAFNGRETPTRGRELSILEQLLGNLGQGSLLNNNNDLNPGSRPGR